MKTGEVIKSLAMLKMEKNLQAVYEKGYPRFPYKKHSVDFLFGRLRDEVDELEIALDGQLRKEQVKDELADISNIVDYLFEGILNE